MEKWIVKIYVWIEITLEVWIWFIYDENLKCSVKNVFMKWDRERWGGNKDYFVGKKFYNKDNLLVDYLTEINNWKMLREFL